MKACIDRFRKGSSPVWRLAAILSVVGVVSCAASDHSRACDACDACGCESHGGIGSKLRLRFNPVYDTLDSLAGGIEHALGLHRCKRGSGCDALPCDAMPCDGNGCDCGTLERMPATLSKPMPLKPAHPRMNDANLPVVPPLDASQRVPRVVSPVERPVESGSAPANDLREVSPQVPAEQMPMPAETKPEMSPPRVVPSEEASPETGPAQPLPAPKKEKGSIFDELNDPFLEDARRLNQPYRPVRPSALRLNQSSGLPLPQPRTNQIDYRRMQPIGSGLRLAPAPATLRPVNHEEPAVRKPLGGGRVLKPYRQSR